MGTNRSVCRRPGEWCWRTYCFYELDNLSCDIELGFSSVLLRFLGNIFKSVTMLSSRLKTRVNINKASCRYENVCEHTKFYLE